MITINMESRIYALKLLLLLGTASCFISVVADDPTPTAGPTAAPAPAAGAPDNGNGDSGNTKVVSPAPTTRPENSAAAAVVTTPNTDFPGYILYNGSRICFRAAFSCKLIVRYFTAGVSKTKVLETTLTPEATKSEGACDYKTTKFKLVWAGGNYTLSFDFKQTTQASKMSSVLVSTWAASNIGFRFDATDNPDFPAIKTPDVYQADAASDDVHFSAPSNFSYSCVSEEDVPLFVNNNGTKDTSVIDSVLLTLWDVKIQAFELPQTGVFSESASCKPDIEKNLPHQNIAPLIVAACLAAVIVIIVIGYFIMKNRTSTQYSAME